MKKIYLVVALILSLLLGTGTVYVIQAPSKKILVATFIMLTALGFPCFLTFIYGLIKKDAIVTSAGIAGLSLAYLLVLTTGNILCDIKNPDYLIIILAIIFIISWILFMYFDFFKESKKNRKSDILDDMTPLINEVTSGDDIQVPDNLTSGPNINWTDID